MFSFFRSKRIDKYTQAAGKYLESTYVPPLQEQAKTGIKFKFPVSSAEEKKQAQEESNIRYSLRDGDVPEFEDRFQASSVQSVLRQSSSASRASQLARELDKHLNVTFTEALALYIREKGWRDSRVYKAAQMDRRLFSKIMSDRNYKPSKDTALSLVIALELSLKQAEDLLSRAGYTLSHSSKRDVIIEYFIREEIYDLSDINEVLFLLDQKIIGR